MQPAVDADFARYVRARQHRLLRAAHLVCGDERLAQDALESALATVAARWPRVREYPDTVVRQHVYREALAAAKQAGTESLAAELATELATEPASESVRGSVDGSVGGLAALTPRQRAVVVLRHFEERSESDAAEVLGESQATVAGEEQKALATLGMGAEAVGGFLDRASQRLVEVDLADRAWALALDRRARRRRRALSGIGSVAAAAVVVAVALGVERGGSSPSPGPTPSTSVTAPVNRLPDGTMYAAMPLEGDEDQLPDYDAGLPSAIDPEGRAVELSSLAGPPPDVVAVYLRRAGTHYRAVLVPKGRTQVVVDGLDLLPTRDAGRNDGVPLGPKAISADGRWVVFAQPRAVVRLDLRTGSFERYAVPAEDLAVAEWTDGQTVRARTADRSFTLDLGSSSPRAVAAAPAAERLDPRGLPVTDLVGETVSAGPWSASGAVLDQVVTSPVIVRGNGPIYQGLVAVSGAGEPGRVLLAPESPDGQTGRFVSCCTALAWADPSTLLFRSAGYDGSWVLAWNVRTGRVYDVTRLDEGRGVDYPQALALAVGERG
ncbi:hypothetical protein GCM10009867_32060 [Pedococcus aerophilus]|uniref:RNA polymerase sigma factor 70 region 4 type 2 domain-containing protein n=1 Tax=Pedococcus aerophilus TaxID=436356 RepID=A0ABN3UV16_9MICO